MVSIAINSLPNILTDKLPQIKEACHRFGVNRLYVFGSATNTRFSEASDIDFLVSFNKKTQSKIFDNYMALHYYLAEILNRKIDLLTESALQIDVNPYFNQTVEQSKVLIFDEK